MLKAAPFILFIAAVYSMPGHAEELTFPSQGLRTVDIQNAQGNVRIESSTSDQIAATLTKGEYLENCKFSTELRKGRLSIISKANNKLFGKDKCQLDIVVKLPKKMDLEFRIGSGDVTVENVNGTIDFKIGSGNLTLKNVASEKFIGRTGSGNISAEGTMEDVDLKIGAGDVDLTYQTAPTQGSIDVKIGSGTTSIKLPNNANIVSHFKSGTGSLTTDFQNNAAAKFKISGTNGTGDMVIKKI